MKIISLKQEKLKRAAVTCGPVTKSIYVDTETYRRAVANMAAIFNKPCLFAGEVTADQVKLALGQELDIWPDSIADDE